MSKKFKETTKDKLKGYLRLILIFISILLAVSLARNVVRISKVNQKIKEARLRVEKLKRENEKLEAKLESVKTEEFVEKQLRDKLGLAKEGETIVVLPDEEILRKLAPRQEEEEDVLPDPNWKRWLHLFGF